MSFGESLAKLRKNKGMSQEELANNLNVSRQAVSKWESNNSYPETEKIVAICKLFNCSMDELIGIKEGNVKSKNKIFNIINVYFDKFIKGIKMFYCMTFKQKIKCIIEMGFYFCILLLIYIVTQNILTEIIRNLLSILPEELLFAIIQIFNGLYYLVIMLFTIYALVKLYKVRYLDYYENYLNEKKKVEEVENETKKNEIHKVSIKEEKIIIRDANSTFKPFSWIKKTIIIFAKIFSLFGSVTLGITFVLLVAIIIFTLYFINNGILILYIATSLFGLLIGIYVLLEISIKFIFNMKQCPKRLFIMFISAMLIVGLSCGFFACELTTYKINDNKEYNNLKYKEELDMTDSLVIDLIKYRREDVEVIFEKRDNIVIEYYGTKYNITPINSYIDKLICDNRYDNSGYKQIYKIYSYHNYYSLDGETFNDYLRYLIQGIKNKEIINEDDLFYTKFKIYISKDNYEKLEMNNRLYESSEQIFNCYYE